MFGSGTSTLVISNEEMNDNIKTVTSPGQSGLLIKSVWRQKMKQKSKKEDFSECY